MRAWTSADFSRYFDKHSGRNDRLDPARYARLTKLQARAIARESAQSGAVRQPLYVEGEKGNKFFKEIPLNVIGRQGGLCFTNYSARNVKPIRKARARKCSTCPHCGGALAA